jgi:hypothetical protein
VLPAVTVPGPQPLELVTGRGTVRCPAPLQVLAPALQGDARRRDGEVELVLQAELPPRCEVTVLASRFVLPAPLDTALGPLLLAEEQRGAAGTPPLFGALRMARLTSRSGDDGIWRGAIVLPRGMVPRRTFLQLVVVAPGGELGIVSGLGTLWRPQ